VWKVVLKTKTKGTGNPERPGLRIFQVIPPEIEVEPENSEDVSYPN
jgi:hypothetical protein